MESRRKPASEILTGQVDGLNHDGWGVARSGGKAVFVAGALPGETIEYRVRRRQRNFDEAELVRVIEPAADRIVPECPHFGTCGGCALQHLAPQSQLQIKDGMLREALRRIGKVEPAQWLSPLSGNPWGYRRRARLGARFVHAKGRSMVGFRERMSSFVADIGRCPVLVPEVGNLIGDLATLISGMSIATRIPQIEVAAGDDCVVLVLRILSPLSAADRTALLEFEQRHKVRWLLQPGGPSTLEPLQGTVPQLWYGLPDYGLRMAFEPADFIQVNGAMNQLLIKHVLELLQLDADSQVLDLFCGLGNFTLPIATRVQHVLGMEGDTGLVARAQANAAANGLDNVQFAAANLAGEGATPRVHSAASGGNWTHVLLDPPRTGAIDILPAIASLGPRRVVYVSCHTGSLARDLGILITEHGFTLAAAGIVDMFPHTSHVESVAVLEGPGVRR